MRCTTMLRRWLLPAALLTAAPAASAQDVAVQLDTVITTQHTVTIKGQRVSYRATAGNQPVWDSDGRPIASVFYV